ncbi:MAG: PSD1 domain-containing protein [Planctomycetes bacterium]|nr:PSD1 domain-containing protein [Planctomycetota bacterium]
MICTASLVRLLLGTAVSVAALTPRATAQAAGEEIRYGRDVRPILSDRCFRCHGPDERTREAHLRLDQRDAATAARDDGAAIVPGDPAASLLLARVVSHDPDEQMPPPDSGKPALDREQVELLRRWIAQGATYESHWAFTPPERPPLPAAAGEGAGHPVDAFLDAARRARGYPASPPADRPTQARRLFLVLTGLPPTPEELAAFVDDPAGDAYERLVDRLLTEEPYRSRHAEHLASIWLDAGRYADTSGIHMDAGRQAWLWRDWLLQALRDDLPFDQFVVQQLAGDLLPAATAQDKVATGFLRNHVTTDEGGAINEEYLVEYAAERTETVGRVFLGLTIGCARCHDHKYDPLRQEDYYGLFSFFNNNEEPGLYSQSQDSNRALEPFLAVPTDAQAARREQLDAEIATADRDVARTTPEEQRSFRRFLDGLQPGHGMRWHHPTVLAATSSGGATLTAGIDGSVLATGANPDDDTHTIVLDGAAPGQRWLCLEALTDASLPGERIGRASHGNVVLQHVRLEQRAAGGDPADGWVEVPLVYALADVEQDNGDFAVVNLLRDDGRGWAPAGHQGAPSPRAALLLAGREFGGPGTELRVTVAYDSPYKQHVLGRLRLATSAASDSGLETLPLATSGLSVVGPFVAADRGALYDTAFGPELAQELDDQQRFGELSWRFDPKLVGARTHPLKSGPNVHYVAQRVWSPTARRVELAIGSDDGFRVFVDGALVGENRVDRPAAVDQDRVAVELAPGPHLVVLKVVNTGGAGGFALGHAPRDGELPHDLTLALLPETAQAGRNTDRILAAYQVAFSPEHEARVAALAALRSEREQLEAAVRRAMVMQERPVMRETFVLTRGEYDHPDRSRPVGRAIPAMFGTMPDDLPKNRLGLARWMVSADNPLLLRVMANRLWEFVFGVGIVRTSEDFGLQGEWPSHPELLDWLATELRENGYSTRRLLRLLVTSAAFRQDSCATTAAATDPQDRFLSWFPRRRLSAEVIRDQALYVGDLLVEQFGGRSVKPYQPPGLWREVAMVQSNTRTFERGAGDELWRRSLYTYWKRACPPPSLLTFDAPTREFCVVRRGSTNTPLQALVLWNDEQFVEAARRLAERELQAAHAGDAATLQAMYGRATGAALRDDTLQLAMQTLREQRQRYAADPEAARALLALGDTDPPAALPPAELAAWTLLASAFLDLDATVYLD